MGGLGGAGLEFIDEGTIGVRLPLAVFLPRAAALIRGAGRGAGVFERRVAQRAIELRLPVLEERALRLPIARGPRGAVSGGGGGAGRGQEPVHLLLHLFQLFGRGGSVSRARLEHDEHGVDSDLQRVLVAPDDRELLDRAVAHNEGEFEAVEAISA